MIVSKPIPADLITRADFDARTALRPSGCLEWVGSVNQQGYGRVWGRGGVYQAHRVALALAGIALPNGQVVDHLCRNRRCVLVDHLEVTSQRINTARGTGASAAAITARLRGVCINGHRISEVGVHRQRNSWTCAECGRERVRRFNTSREKAGVA